MMEAICDIRVARTFPIAAAGAPSYSDGMLSAGRFVALAIALIGGCTLTTPLDELGAGSTTQATTGAGASTGAAGGDVGGSVVELTLSAMVVNHHRIDLVWTSGLGAVDIERDGNILRSAVEGTSFQDRGLEPSTSYTYRIRAGDTWSLPEPATTSEEPTGSYSDHVVSDEPRAYWRLEQSPLIDSMGNISSGTIDGVPTVVPGKIGNAIAFNGSEDSADLHTVHTADSEWGWSWELWVHFSAVYENDSGLLGCPNTPRLAIIPSGAITVGLSKRNEVGFLGWTSDVVFESAVWHHFVLTIEGAITNAPLMKVYANGDLVGLQNYAVAIHSPWSRGNQGTNSDGELNLNRRDGFETVKGSYDEAAAYDYVLSAAQIERHYQIGSLPP